MSRLIIGPFNRVEGDLEVTLDVAEGVVRQAFVTAPLHRGFERILLGRPPGDAVVIAPRICGICSVSQSTAAVRALAGLSGLPAPPNGRLAADLVLACEVAADHLSHFHLFFMPDFARATYAAKPWFPAARRRFAALTGEAAREAPAARARFLHLMGLLAGKWPHTLALQPGGTTKGVDSGEKMRLLSILAEFRSFLETRLFAAPLERIAALDSADSLNAWAWEAPPEHGDFRLFLHLARDLGLDGLGRGSDLLMSSGAHGGLFKPGLWRNGQVAPLDLAALTEDPACAWLSGGPRHPAQGVTLPDADKPGAYSWAKAPRLDGQSVEVGALARQMVDGHPLLRDLWAEAGSGTVLSRIVARMVELARLLPAMEAWIHALRPREPFCVDVPIPPQGSALGMVEAARGMLGHWLRIEDGRIAHYQIVAPTTWNFSPRDEAGRPGPLESALAGTPVPEGERVPVAIQHVVRSFDPCMACTVH